MHTLLIIGGPTITLSPLAQIGMGAVLVLVCVVGLVWSRSRGN